QLPGPVRPAGRGADAPPFAAGGSVERLRPAQRRAQRGRHGAPAGTHQPARWHRRRLGPAGGARADPADRRRAGRSGLRPAAGRGAGGQAPGLPREEPLRMRMPTGVKALVLLAGLAVAGPGRAVDWPDVPVPEGATGETVSSHMIYNGMSMRASRFTVDLPVEEVKAFYR